MGNVYEMLSGKENDSRQGTPMRCKSARRMRPDEQCEQDVGQLGE